MTSHDTNNSNESVTATHSVDSAVRDEDSDTADSNFDRSSLSTLYPNPKTFDEKQKDKEQREELHKERLPKYPHIKIAFSGGALLTAALLLIQKIGGMWMGGGIAGIFFSFALWLALLGAIVWWIKYVNTVFYAFDVSTILFWIGCSVTLYIIAILYMTGWPIDFTTSYSVLILSLIHSFASATLSRILLRQAR